MPKKKLERTIKLADLVEVHPKPLSGTLFHISPRQRHGRWQVALVSETTVAASRSLWAAPREKCGDAPDKYHPKYVMAVLSAQSPLPENTKGEPVLDLLQQWPVPRIDFSTEEFVRRSMSLNGMRMSMEYFETGSRRVVQLIEQRLEAGQRDIVHDVLVYLMQRVLDLRAAEREARSLRAESVAAYLGLNQDRVNQLFLAVRLMPERITAQIEAEYAGPIRRKIDVPGLVAAQVNHLKPSLRQFRHQEQHALKMIDETLRLLS